MKNIFNLFGIVILIIGGFTKLQSQPKPPVLKPAEAKGFNYYLSNAKKESKENNWRGSAAFGIYALTIAAKKRQIKKAQEQLAIALPLVMSTSEEQIASLRKQNNIYQDDSSVDRQLNLLAILIELENLRAFYAKLSSDKFANKSNLNLSFVGKDFSNDIVEEEKVLAGFLKKSAAKHFEAAAALEHNTSWQKQFERAKHLEQTIYFQPNFENAKEKWIDAKNKGTCRLVFTSIVNQSKAAIIEPVAIQNGIFSNLKTQKAIQTHKYFEVFGGSDRQKGNTEMVINITKIYKEDGEISASEKEHSEEVDGVVVKATSTKYTKMAYVYIHGSYVIRDIKTKAVLEENEFKAGNTWTHSWAKISGNEKAVNKQRKYLATLTDKPFPNLQEMIDETGGGAYSVVDKMKGLVIDFAEKYK